MSNDDTDDELLRRAREARRDAAGVREHSARNGRSVSERLLGDSLWIQKIAAFFKTAGKYLGPLGALLAWLLRLIAKWFRWAAIRPSESGDPEFSWKRLFLNTTLSITAVLMLHVVFSAVYYYSTYFDEIVYVTGKQEIETGELYQFGGCTSLPCSTETDNGKFYLIASSLYFPVMFYPEENVFANIPQQDAACHVEGYGIYFRSLRWLYKSAQLYQHIVKVSCRPYTDEETRRAVKDGRIEGDR